MENTSKKTKIFRICNIILSIICLSITLTILIYDAVTNFDIKRFVKAGGLLIVFVIPYLIELIFKRRFGNLTLFIYTLFIVISGLLGALFVMGNYIPFYDKISHTLYGYLACYIGLYLATTSNIKSKHSILTVSLFCVMFSISTHVLWEIWEYTFDTLGGFTMQGKKVFGVAPLVTDTMFDIIVNLFGAVVFAMHYQIHATTNKNLMIGTLKKEFNDFYKNKKLKNQQEQDINNTDNQQQEQNNNINDN